MESSKVIGIAIVIAIAMLVVMIVITDPDEDWERYNVTYELDGGEFLNTPPDHYYSGMTLTISSPIKEGYTFQGWYLDEEHTKYFDGNTRGLKGDIVLYATWGDNLSGHYVTLSKKGYCERGYDSYDMTGTLTFTYLYYDGDKQSYYIHNDGQTTYKYRNIWGGTYTEDDSRSYWSGESGDKWEDKGTETITTAAGEKECSVIQTIHSNGVTETQWIGDGWIPYKIVTKQSYWIMFVTYDMECVYTYVEDGVVELPKDCVIDVYQGYGITIAGNNSPYSLGQTAALTATVSDGKEFKGWFDEEMNLLSSNLTYKFIVGSSLTLYALNTDPVDITFTTDTRIDLDSELGVDKGTYIIKNNDTGAVYEATSTYTFTEGGPYTILSTDSNGGKGYYEVKVSGDVERSFTWKYNRTTYTLTLDIDYDDLLYTRAYYTTEQRAVDSTHVRDKTFVTLSYTDDRMAPYMEELVDKLIAELQKRYTSINETTLLGYLLAFTQYIEYQSDEQYMGVEEYWKFPLETLYDQGGDCEDTSILFAAIAHEARAKLDMSYKVAIQLLPGHMAGAIKLAGSSWGYVTNPTGYIYCETTSTEYRLGDVPSGMKEYYTSTYYYRDDYSTTLEIQ